MFCWLGKNPNRKGSLASRFQPKATFQSDVFEISYTLSSGWGERAKSEAGIVSSAERQFFTFRSWELGNFPFFAAVGGNSWLNSVLLMMMNKLSTMQKSSDLFVILWTIYFPTFCSDYSQQSSLNPFLNGKLFHTISGLSPDTNLYSLEYFSPSTVGCWPQKLSRYRSLFVYEQFFTSTVIFHSMSQAMPRASVDPQKFASFPEKW